MKYIISFEFLNSMDIWVFDTLTNNGKGFTWKEPENVVNQLKHDSVCIKRNLCIQKM